MEELQKNAVGDDEITLKELIGKIQEYFWYVLQYWKIVAIAMVVCIVFMLYKAFTTGTTYKAQLTFMVNEDEGSNFGGMAGILGNFGISGGGGGKFNLAKIIELSKSIKIIQSVLMHKCQVDGSFDMIANHLIRIYDLHEEWEDSENEKMHGFLFTHDSLHLFDEMEKSVFKSMYNRIIDAKKFSSSFSKESGIMQFAIETPSAELSIAVTETLYEKLSVYYVEKAIGKQQLTYDLMKSKVDSIAGLLSSKEIELALFNDRNRGLFTQRDQLRGSVLQREVAMLTLMYGESVKNLEIADFSLKNKTPFIQVIDRPLPPLYPISKSKLMAIIIGGFLGGILGAGFLIFRKVVSDVMADG